MTDPSTATMPQAIWTAASLTTQQGSHIRLSVGKERAYLVPMIRAGAAGNEVFVADRILGLRVGNPTKAASLEPASDNEYRRYLLFGTRDGALSMVGLGLAVFGFLIQAFNTLSEAGVVWDIGKPGRAVVGTIGLVLQILGTGLLFWRGVLAGKLT